MVHCESSFSLFIQNLKIEYMFKFIAVVIIITDMISSNSYPDFLIQYTPDVEPRGTLPLSVANVGCNKVVVSNSSGQMKKKAFQPIALGKTSGPLIIYEKRWYFRLVSGNSEDHKRSRALMDDFDLNEISRHMVVCFTPNSIPGQRDLFRTKDGKLIHIYAYFDSYLEFYEYMQKFPVSERAFYEIIFGELPQKPHFDIDIDLKDFQDLFPNDDIDKDAEFLLEAVITACIEVLAENSVILNLERDLLLYSSHGAGKRSYHVIINNKCHDDNKEAKAFYEAVMVKVHALTGNKYVKTNFVDKGVYNPRQQFRLMGCQKQGSNRPKSFYERFLYRGVWHTHIYNEDVKDPIMKKLTIIYESMVSFTSGCVYLPSLVPIKPVNFNALGDFPDLERGIVEQCLKMLQNKMKDCPFSLREVKGHYIILKREASSLCPVCDRVHEAEHPYMYITNGRVYWDCRRSAEYAENKKFLVGYLGMTIEELQNGATFFENEVASGDILPESEYIPPPEQRRQNINDEVTRLGKEIAQKKYLRREPENLMDVKTLSTITSQVPWVAGYSNR